MLAQDLITRAPVLVHAEDALSDAARRMRDAEVGSVVVMDRGQPVGILTDRDLALLLTGDTDQVRVDDVMTVSGHRISTTEVESAIVDHQAVAEAAVTGRKDEHTGQAIAAFVTPRAGTA